jgi:hypothetical protein
VPMHFGWRSAPAPTYQQSRDQAQKTEFVWWVLVFLAAAVIAYNLVQRGFADPLSSIETALGSSQLKRSSASRPASSEGLWP